MVTRRPTTSEAREWRTGAADVSSQVIADVVALQLREA